MFNDATVVMAVILPAFEAKSCIAKRWITWREDSMTQNACPQVSFLSMQGGKRRPAPSKSCPPQWISGQRRRSCFKLSGAYFVPPPSPFPFLQILIPPIWHLSTMYN